MRFFRVGSALVSVETTWPLLRDRAQSKGLDTVQFEEDSELIEVLFIDAVLAYVTTIYKTVPPQTFPRTPAENAADLVDFNTNWRPVANAPLSPRAASHVTGVAAAKGLGGYLPNPSNNPYMPRSDELVSLYVDGEGSLVTRGAVLTDEGSFRNDFNGPALAYPLTGMVRMEPGSDIVLGYDTRFLTEVSKTAYLRPYSVSDDYWGKVARIIDDTHVQLDAPYEGPSVPADLVLQAEAVPVFIGNEPGTLTLQHSKLRAASGTKGGCGVGMFRQGDYGPMEVVAWLSMDHRRATQSTWFGLRDDQRTPSMCAEIVFEGTDDTKVKFRTMFQGEAEVTEVSLPAGKTTADQLRYRVFASSDHCFLKIADEPPVAHDLHIPGPYDEMDMGGAIVNLADTDESVLLVDCVLFQNFNRLATKEY